MLSILTRDPSLQDMSVQVHVKELTVKVIWQLELKAHTWLKKAQPLQNQMAAD